VSVLTSADAGAAARARPLIDDAALARRVVGAPCVVLLDVDGTLAPIAPRPEDAAVPEATRRAVERLVAARDVTVGLLSGRAATEARRLVGVDRVWAIGNHGAESIAPDGAAAVHPDVAAAGPALAAAAADLESALAGIPGTIVEDKRWSLSVHYRLTPPELVDAVAAAVQRAAGARGLRVVRGKAVLELRVPVTVDKGTAAVWLVERLGADAPGASVLFIGDDVTDEDAFRALRARCPAALTVRVVDEVGHGVPETAAEFHVPGTAGVRRLLERVAELRGT
jgi:trehalose-phosphatase